MVKFELKKHYLVEKPKISSDPILMAFRSPGVYTTEVDGHYITNTHIIGGNNITATRSNTTYTENLEVTGEVRYPGAIRYVNGNFEIWDSDLDHWRTLDTDRDIFIPSPPRENKTNIFKRIYDYIIQRFSI
jgi:hypothetical protein